jgi:hypothetical protein
MDLLWSNTHGPEVDISPDVEKHCDIGFVVDPGSGWYTFDPRKGIPPGTVTFTFEVVAKPNHQGHIVGPGTYRLKLLVVAANAASVQKVLEIRISGDWLKDEDLMLSDRGVTLRIVQ